jgi:CO/xanthine dehydrogenase FAD-binding subunit
VATHACDLPPALLAMGALVEVHGPDGSRAVPVEELYTGDGLRPTTLGPGEVICGVRIPWPAQDHLSTYAKLRVRKAVDRPLLGLAIAGLLAADLRVRGLRIGVVGVGPAVSLVPGLADFDGVRLDSPAIAEVARLAAEWLRPSPALRVDPAWRRAMGRTLVERGLEALVRRAAARPTRLPGRVARETDERLRPPIAR